MTAIDIERLQITYGDNTVISDLSLRIEDGEFFTLLGPSGCGKTTLLRTIAGFITPASGSISFGGKNVTDFPTHKRNIGMVFQDYALFPDKTVNTNVAYGLKARGVNRADIPGRVAEALERVGMGGFGDRLPSAISGGQRQRVALARALVIRPSVLLMDEPLSNLDAKLRLQIRESISDLQREVGITTVFVTHDQEEALAMSDRIALFRSGNIEQLGSPTEIYRHPRTSYAADFIGTANVIPVTLSGASEANSAEEITVRLGDHALRGQRRAELSGSTAFAIARPEHLSLVALDGAGAIGAGATDAGSTGAGSAEAASGSSAAHQRGTLIPGEVVRRQYLGRVQQHTVRLAGGAVVETSEPANAVGHAQGSTVNVLFPAAETLVLAS